jgi:hypothetical protein
MARDFNGTTDYLSGTSLTGLDTATYSVCCWVRVDSQPPGGNWTLYLTASTLAAGNQRDGFVLLPPGTAGFRLRFFHKWGSANANWDYLTDLGLTTWTHVGVTYDRGNIANDPVVYINGSAVSVSETAAPSGSVATGAATMRMAANATGASIADIQLAEWGRWNRILSAAEMLALGKGYEPRVFPRGLVKHFPLIGRQSPEPCVRTAETLSLVSAPARYDHPRILMAA